MGAYGGARGCVPPALLLNSSSGSSPEGTPGSSRVASPVSGSNGYMQPSASTSQSQHPSAQQSQQCSQQQSSTQPRPPTASTTLSRPATSLLLSKPFKCPKPNCNKSYKQANGLKYHMTHGSCNFAPPKDLEHIQALVASRRREKAEGAGLGHGCHAAGTLGGEGGAVGGLDELGELGLSETEMREVEKEAERRVRPYACGVGECQRRYKNMNGLRTSPPRLSWHCEWVC